MKTILQTQIEYWGECEKEIALLFQLPDANDEIIAEELDAIDEIQRALQYYQKEYCA